MEINFKVKTEWIKIYCGLCGWVWVSCATNQIPEDCTTIPERCPNCAGLNWKMELG